MIENPQSYQPGCELCKRIIPLVEIQSEEIQKLQRGVQSGRVWAIIAIGELFMLIGLAVYAAWG